ncbi:MAG: tRNA (adenosine(37)-N6)-threonylcarbamoyltransferase complex ATPase subunit type 1 TsaE [Polyangiales bacterium]
MESESQSLSVQSEAEMLAFASRVAALLEPGHLVILEGDLGAGKTFFSRAIAYALGVPDDLPVTSPTFALVHDYPESEPPLLHADLYRLTPGDPLEDLGLESDDHVRLVEWGAAFVEELGAPDLLIRIFLTGETSRRVEVSGPLAAAIVRS